MSDLMPGHSPEQGKLLKLALAAVLGIAAGWWLWLRPQQSTPSGTTDVPILPSGTASAQSAGNDPGFDPKDSQIGRAHV